MMDLTNLKPPQITLIGSGVCVFLTIHFTIQLVSQHLFHWKNPKEQKAILIIILMAPIYATVSFVGLLDVKGSETFFLFLESIKECYEALVIAKFLALMYSYLNISISKNVVPDGIKGREIHHSFPMTLFQPHVVRLDHRTLKLLKYWTWQFVIIRPVCSILMIAFQILGIYPSWLSWTFTIVLNISVSLALYSLVVFYHVFAKELAPHNPLAKFLCIKGIVFFCFWQGVALDILVAMGIIKSKHVWLEVEQIQEAIQNVLVCVEMVAFALVQKHAYHVGPYKKKMD
ncbi:PREDICTED: transmembrane protein 184C [Tarenaya hassleriana]|uniref:transmembrane protein 184C n=1 Tax=Tarenaya hassleriana TaxID=28532 RepID=UPI00053C35C3|nr:PREDICTED: transmembrane protein 184C [Tarenaya hassleriana]